MNGRAERPWRQGHRNTAEGEVSSRRNTVDVDDDEEGRMRRGKQEDGAYCVEKE